MKILLPIDGSGHSDAVVQELIDRPWPSDTEVRVISVAHPSPEIPDPLLVGRALHIDSLNKEPMAFVRGLMGPYMRPIPVGASSAMFFSLLVTFVVSPWAAMRLVAHVSGHKEKASGEDGWTTRLYRRIMSPLILSASSVVSRRTGGVAADCSGLRSVQAG